VYRYLGCQFRAKNGDVACPNRIKVRVEEAERALLAGIQAELLNPDTIAYVTAQLTDTLKAVTDQRPARIEALMRQRDASRAKVHNLIAAVESGITSTSILQALSDRETEAARLDAEIAALSQPTDDRRLAVLPTWVRQQLEDVAGLLYDAPDRARNEFERLGLRFSPFVRSSTFLRALNRFSGQSAKDTSSTSQDRRSLLPADRSCEQRNAQRKQEEQHRGREQPPWSAFRA